MDLLPLLWAIVILFGIMMYVVMDGFDLGIGILFPFFPEKADRDVMMNTVAPIWDGNETWLVLGGAGLLAAFPLAYSVILSAFYLPLILMLIGLIFRGVAFEFRFKARPGRRRAWDKSFAAGSFVAAFFQGVTLGGFVQGVPVRDNAYAGGAFDWITPFAVFSGFGLCVAYALLGATWLVMKTEGPLQAQMRSIARYLVWALLAFIGGISIWTPLIEASIAQRWFAFPNLLWLSPVPLLVAATTWLLLRELRRDAHASPFVLTLGMIFLGYLGLGISIWPNVIPYQVSIWDAAGPRLSMGFALIGTLFIVPIILFYTAWSYWVFRGKVRPGEGYH
ncbi:MAG: cytochrome d ubiquinol oxidase subunit II [Betaproteobacteria bacterium]|nr:cytochrome d ubiquinol oxidase subunit II [Betaproteobacteria bacterium]